MIRVFKNTKSDKLLLLNYLKEVNYDFNPALSSHSKLEEFVNKILLLGNVYAYFINEVLAGVICFYSNNLDTNTAYCSVLSVKDEFRRRGIANSLIDFYINFCCDRKIKNITIHTNNKFALNLYLKKGFHVVNSSYTEGRERFFLKFNINL